MKKYFMIACLIMAAAVSRAQYASFIQSGKISYTRVSNNYTQFEGIDESYVEIEKKLMPQFKKLSFELYFTPQQTLYKPGKENPENINQWHEPAESNVISNDLSAAHSVSQKNIFGAVVLIDDSTRKIRWHMTDETRDIAGFKCHRANALIMDSVYVVAFYTDEIICPGGPESFTGLPGMILGVSLPHKHITWFADKVEVMDIGPAQLTAPQKGKKITARELIPSLGKSMADWGRQARRYLELAAI